MSHIVSPRLCSLVLGTLLVLTAPPVFAADFSFTDVTAASGIAPLHAPTSGMGSGAAAADADGDGDVDLFVPQDAQSRLYENQGGGTFVEIAAAAGLGAVSSRAALWLDADNDGDLDLVTVQDGAGFRLFRNDGALTFTDVTAASGDLATVTDAGHVGGLAAGDVDNDGDVDLYAGFWHGDAYLFLNQGGLTFDDITATSGVGVGFNHWQPVMFDADDDGFVDIYQPMDIELNLLWINQGDNTFVDRAAEAGVEIGGTDMGATVGDFDDDGDLDLYVTQISDPSCWVASGPNSLFRNGSTGTPGVLPSFTQDSGALGTANTYWGWGTTFLDADRDGDLDLAATNGFTGACRTDPARFFSNPGDGTAFLDVSTEVGFDNSDWGSALVAFDADRDGDLDLMQVGNDGDPLRLLRNDATSANHHLVVKPRTTCRNRFALGAVVRVTAGGRTMTRRISAGTSFLGQEPAEAFFGLGTATSAETVTVEWPDGTVTSRSNVAADQVLGIVQPPAVDCDANGVEDACDSGTFAFAVDAEGGRYVGVTPSFAGSDPLAIRVTDGSGGSDVACFVQADGTVGTSPVFRTPAQWCRVHVHGAEIVPGATYSVDTWDGTTLTASLSATTPAWGDVDENGTVNFGDISLVVDAFNGDFSSAALEATDLAPPLDPGLCQAPDRQVDMLDVDASVAAFEGQAFPCTPPPFADACTLCAGGCPDNGLFCDGDEVCDPILGCRSTGNPCPPNRRCKELTDTCAFLPGPGGTG